MSMESSYDGDGGIPGRYWATTTSVLDMAASFTRRVLPELSLNRHDGDDDWDEWTDVTGSCSSGCCSEWSDEEEEEDDEDDENKDEVVIFPGCECDKCVLTTNATFDVEAASSCLSVTPLCLSDEERSSAVRDKSICSEVSGKKQQAFSEVLVGALSENCVNESREVKLGASPSRNTSVVLWPRRPCERKADGYLPSWAAGKREYVPLSRRNPPSQEGEALPSAAGNRSQTDIEATFSKRLRFPQASQFLSLRAKAAEKFRQRQRHCSLDDTQIGISPPPAVGLVALPERRPQVHSDETSTSERPRALSDAAATRGRNRNAILSREADRQSYLLAVDPNEESHKRLKYASALRSIFAKPSDAGPAGGNQNSPRPANFGEGSNSRAKSLRVSSAPLISPSSLPPNVPYTPFNRASPQRQGRRVASTRTTPVHRSRRVLPPTPQYTEVPPLYANLKGRSPSLPRSTSTPTSHTEKHEAVPGNSAEGTPKRSPKKLLSESLTKRKTPSASDASELEKSPPNRSMRRRLARRRNPLNSKNESIGHLGEQRARLEKVGSRSAPNGLNRIVPFDDLEELKIKKAALSPQRQPKSDASLKEMAALNDKCPLPPVQAMYKDMEECPLPPVRPMYKDMIQLDVRHIAEELTLIDASLLQKIECHELSNCAWIHKDRNTRAPNIMTMVEAFNRLALITTTEVLKPTTTTERAKAVAFFIKIAEQCLKLHNYNSLKAILAGLQCTPLFRLKRTWKEVSAAKKKRFTELSDLMSETKNYTLYRQSMTDALAKGACIPFLGVFLTQVVQIESYIMLQNRMRRSRFGSRRASKRRMSTRRKSSAIASRKRSQARMLSRSAETLVMPMSPSPQPVETVLPANPVDNAIHNPHKTNASNVDDYECNSACNSCCVSCCNSTCNSACPSFPGSPTRAQAEELGAPCCCQIGVDATVAVETATETAKTNTHGLGMRPATCTNLNGQGEGSAMEDSAYGSDGSTRTNSLSHHSRESSADSNVTASICSPEVAIDTSSKKLAIAIDTSSKNVASNTRLACTTPDIKKPPRASVPPSFFRNNSQTALHQPEAQTSSKSPHTTLPLLRGKLKAVLIANSAKTTPKAATSTVTPKNAENQGSVCVDGGLEAAFSSLEERLECYKKASALFGHCSRPWVRYFLEHVDYNTEEKNYKLSLQREPKIAQARTWLARLGNR